MPTIPDVYMENSTSDTLTLAFGVGLALFFCVVLFKCGYEYFLANYGCSRPPSSQSNRRNQLELANQQRSHDSLPSYVDLCQNEDLEAPILNAEGGNQPGCDEVCDVSPPPYETVLVDDVSPLQPDSQPDTSCNCE